LPDPDPPFDVRGVDSFLGRLGLVDIEMGKPLLEAGVTARIPVGRAGLADEIAEAVLLLVRNGYITGQTIAVNGGALFS